MKKMKKGWNIWIAITCEEGCGMSYASFQLARALCAKTSSVPKKGVKK